MKRTTRLSILALAAALAFAGCGQYKLPYEWAIEPQFGYEAVEPVFDPTPMAEGTVCQRQGETGFYLAKTEQGWGVLNTADGTLLLENVFVRQPLRCGMGHLYDLYAHYDAEQEKHWNAELAKAGSSFTMEIGHGGWSRCYMVEPKTQQVMSVETGEGSYRIYLLSRVEDAFSGLLPVRKGALQENFDWADPPSEEDIVLEENGWYAIASPKGEILTEFVYENASMSSGGLVAVQKEGKWGYVNEQGTEVIPCKYEPFWGYQRSWNEKGEEQITEPAWPAPATEGTVVVVKDGQYALLDTTGKVLIPFGTLEAMAPAAGGLLWAKQNGLWGALKLA